MKEFGKSTEKIRTVDVRAEIRTQYIQITSRRRYLYIILFGLSSYRSKALYND
jgi:hypothetical protein